MLPRLKDGNKSPQEEKMARRYKEGLLPFKIVAADQPLIARSGPLLPYEMAKALKLPRVYK